MSRTLYLLVPLLNESANVGRLLANIAQAAPSLCELAGSGELRVLLIDDGSSDDTVALATQAPVPFSLEVLRHERNRGPGAAFATGFAALQSRLHEQDLVFTMEGDNTSSLPTAQRLLVRQKEGYDAVLASPYAYGGGFRETSLLRLILSHGANSVLKGLIGLRGIHTMSSFFRLYTGSLLLRLQQVFGPGIIERAGFEGMVELLIKMCLLKASLSEVEMLLDSSQRVGRSKMKILRTIRGYLTLVRRHRAWAAQASGTLWSYDRRDP